MIQTVPGIPILKPFVDDDNREFWAAIKRHEFVLPKCKLCGRYYWIPRPMCPECRVPGTMGVAPSAGRGKVHAFVVFDSPAMAYPAFVTPYTIVLVELEEGPRIISFIDGVKPEDVAVGMPVEVDFVDFQGCEMQPEAVTVYVFKKRPA
jgi:uncharacterized OB-fold protein